jgi:aerobic-type carbon monoxide dehydrogenase small subunit (CoxS/CutS family)
VTSAARYTGTRAHRVEDPRLLVVSVTAFLRDHPNPTDEQILEALSGNFCRCTGYHGITAAMRAAADAGTV